LKSTCVPRAATAQPEQLLQHLASLVPSSPIGANRQTLVKLAQLEVSTAQSSLTSPQDVLTASSAVQEQLPVQLTSVSLVLTVEPTLFKVQLTANLVGKVTTVKMARCSQRLAP